MHSNKALADFTLYISFPLKYLKRTWMEIGINNTKYILKSNKLLVKGLSVKALTSDNTHIIQKSVS